MSKKVRFTMLALVLTFSIFGIVCRAKANSTYRNTYNSTYGTSVGCTFCHTSPPALNATGTKFMDSGFNYASIAPVPAVTAFSIPATSTSLAVPITTFTATDNVPITGYMVTESTTPPSASAAGWSASLPSSFTFATTGTKTLYAWAKDAANIVSPSKSASVTITLPPAPDTLPPTVNSFTIPSTSSSLTVAISSFSATDNVAVTGYLVTESASTPSASASGWVTSLPSNYTFATAGTKTLHAWAKDTANNVSASFSASVTVVLQDAPAPTDLSIWVGKWFKLATKITGSCSGGSGLISDSGSSVGYLKLWEWDSNNQILQGDLYEYDTATSQWSSQSLSLQFIAGSDRDFLSQSQGTDNAASITEGFTARIVGKGTGGVLKSATFKSLGGYYIDTLNQSGSIMNCAGGLKLTGALIQELKVPVPAEVITH